MKVRMEFEDNLIEDEIIIKCKSMNGTIQKIQESILNITKEVPKLSFYKEDKEYYLQLDDIIFFETSDSNIYAHTADDVYFTQYRLYELEEMLPKNFIRASKSAIINLNKIFSINRSLASSNLVQFYKSHKQVYISRYYYKEVKAKLGERRIK